MNKTALVTGASSGIGKATAIALNDLGWKVYAGARRVELMDELQARGIETIQLDVTVEESMVACIDKITSEQGRIDALINNAGYGSYGALEDVPMSEAKYQFEVNVFGVARLTQLVLPYMRDQRSGRIVNISSIGGSLGEPHGAWYHGTKWALEGISDSLRMELKQFGIDVIVIKPGAILTEWSTIAQQKLLQVSGSTAYAKLAHKHAAMLNKYDQQGSSPTLISDAIVHACTASKPKTRYVRGKGAATIMFLKGLLSDRMMDRLMLGMMK